MKHPTLPETVAFAVAAHGGQADKTGRPYFWHLFEVAALVRETSVREESQHIAFLHDIVEDGCATLDDLRLRGYSQEIIDNVDVLTRRQGEPYQTYIDRIIRHGGAAMFVKRADIKANVVRLPAIEDAATRARLLMKYRAAMDLLTRG